MINRKLLVFIDYYLPGYKAGGPINTLANMIKILAKEKKINFYIVTRDRDLGDNVPYPSVEYNIWTLVGGANVMYLSPSNMNLRKILEIIQSQDWDKIYLNSFFSKWFSISIIILKKIFNIKIPILLSPKGEFSAGALRIKSPKKLVYIFLTKILQLYKDVTWHLTDNFELEAVKKVFGDNIDYKIASDPVYIDKKRKVSVIEKNNETLLILFLSRISKMKNLDVCLKVLGKLDSMIFFDIYGPVEDEVYWLYCKSLIINLPKNIIVRYCGEVLHYKVYDVISKYHMLFLPTAGENFGYVIFESLLVGRPVLIGNDTPWKGLVAKNIGADINPKDTESFIREINRFLQMTQEEFNAVSKNCNEYAISKFDMNKQLVDIRNLFK